MSESLAARGHEVHVVTYHLGERLTGLPFSIHRIPNVPTYRKTSPGPAYQKVFVLDPLLAIKLLWVVRSQKPDIIHAHHYEGLLAGWFVSRLTGVPLVFDVHTLLSTELPLYSLGLPASFLKWLGRRLDQVLPHRADHIIAVTNTIREKLIREIGISGDKVTTVYSGVEVGHFAQRLVDSPAAASTLIYTGNLAAYQDVDALFRAFRLVLDRRPDTILKIVTESPLDGLQPLISSLRLQPNLRFERANYFNLPFALHTAMIAVNPRVDADGLPAKLLNYMATGRAIVSFEGSGEVLEHGKTALVVPHGNEQGFADAILKLLDDPELAGQLGRAAQAVVQEFFVWESMERIIEDVYKKLLEKDP
jgi:glycosyltransferase involved in cell wall biosynthesis